MFNLFLRHSVPLLALLALFSLQGCGSRDSSDAPPAPAPQVVQSEAQRPAPDSKPPQPPPAVSPTPSQVAAVPQSDAASTAPAQEISPAPSPLPEPVKTPQVTALEPRVLNKEQRTPSFRLKLAHGRPTAVVLRGDFGKDHELTINPGETDDEFVASDIPYDYMEPGVYDLFVVSANGQATELGAITIE